MTNRHFFTTFVALTVAPILFSITIIEGRLIDLSHPQTEDTYMSTPLDPKYTTNLLFEGELAPGVYSKWSSYAISEHGGTHIDAPLHFARGGYSVSDIPLENTIADGIMIDCTEEVAKNPVYMLTLQKVLDWEEVHGKIPPKSAVVINFNWSHKYPNKTEYLNPTDPKDYNSYRFPSLGIEAATFLVDERDMNIMAIDSMSPDLMDTLFPVHVKLLSRNKFIVENIKDPGRLPPKGFRLHASPVKFVGGTGVQTRVYAMVFDDNDDDDDDDDDEDCSCLPCRGRILCSSVALILIMALAIFVVSLA